MKTSFIFNINSFSFVVALIATSLFFTSCDNDDPTKEDTPELITKVTLTFTPAGGGNAVIATATDPDGEGVQDIVTDGPIDLLSNTNYTLTLELINELATVGQEGYNITEEIEEESDEHMFFFSWTEGVFNEPSGDGNVNNGADEVNYEDTDDMGLPVGLETSWTTGDPANGNFRIILKHQPGLKSSAPSVSIGETDLDIAFEINVQ